MDLFSQFKKIFGLNQSGNRIESHFKQYRERLAKLDLKTIVDLENLIIPLILKTDVMKLNEPRTKLPESNKVSNFGGLPYMEIGEKWPKTKCGKNLDFIFQVYIEDDIAITNEIALIQFFYNWELSPWKSEEDGWLVKLYKYIDKGRIDSTQIVDSSVKYCEIDLKKGKSLPDWEGIDRYEINASDLSCILNEEEPWGKYQELALKLTGNDIYRSQLGGYPIWVQGESTPLKENGEPYQLLFQLDSENKASLMWGDVGCIYVFYDSENEDIKFELQCH